ncbi:MAG: hypothetical protein QOF76_1931 [Solirubrobacteraceae bacterium]|jgi:predicted dehydrogenase|nr:hypothetical protein [Solirubrobacteraceae bacterium]
MSLRGDVVRLAVVGCGDVTTRYLESGDRLERAGGAVVALCEPDEERLARMGARFGVAGLYRSLEQALAGTAVDAVVNLTPTPAHAAVTTVALRNGCDVYSEKPLAPNLGEGIELARLADAEGRVLLCAPATVVFPIWRMARRMLSDGVIGSPLAMRARFDMPPLPWKRHQTGATWFIAPDVGPLRDVGIYALHAMLDLFGAPVSVAARTATLRGWTPEALAAQEVGPDAVTVILGFEGGAAATLETGFFVHASLTPWAEIYGDRGTMALDMRARDEAIRVCRVESALDHSSAAPDWDSVSRQEIVRTLGCDTSGADGWFDYMAGLEEFLDVIRSPRDSPLSADRACQVLDVIDRAYAAAAAATDGTPAPRSRRVV